jgi:hypothetical protein
MKPNFLWDMLKFAVACSGPASVVFHIHLFKEYFEVGKPAPDKLHAVVLNNHGVNRYITEAQSHSLDISLAVAVGLLVAFFGMIVARLRKGRK